jgi:hypothetical protein
MTDEIDEAIDHVLSGGLTGASAGMVQRHLAAELQQQAELYALASDAEQEAWVLGGADAGGFGSIAQRFLTYYAPALRQALCDEQGDGLSQQYRAALDAKELRQQVAALTPAILPMLDSSPSLVVPATVAALVALWLVRVGPDQWCASPGKMSR